MLQVAILEQENVNLDRRNCSFEVASKMCPKIWRLSISNRVTNSSVTFHTAIHQRFCRDLLEAAEKRWINFDTSTAKGMVVSRDLEGAFLFAVSPRMSPFPFHLMWLQHGKPTFAKVKRISYSPFAKNLFGIRYSWLIVFI